MSGSGVWSAAMAEEGFDIQPEDWNGDAALISNFGAMGIGAVLVVEKWTNMSQLYRLEACLVLFWILFDLFFVRH